MPEEIKSRMTVADLIQKLQEFQQDLPVAINFDIFETIDVSLETWTHTNYPYDKPDIKFVNLG